MGIHILGTAAQNIDRAEDRSKFSAMCDELGIDQPEWSEFVKMEDGRSAFLDSAGEKKGHCMAHGSHGWLMYGAHGTHGMGVEPGSCLLEDLKASNFGEMRVKWLQRLP